MKKPTDINSKKVADPTKQQYAGYICTKTKGIIWYYAGRSDTYSYWCKNKNRAIKYIIPYHAEREFKQLRAEDGHKRCYIENTTEELNEASPALFYKKIKH